MNVPQSLVCVYCVGICICLSPLTLENTSFDEESCNVNIKIPLKRILSVCDFQNVSICCPSFSFYKIVFI